MLFKYFLTGVAITLAVLWTIWGGFEAFNYSEAIVVLMTIGMAIGYWIADVTKEKK